MEEYITIVDELFPNWAAGSNAEKTYEKKFPFLSSSVLFYFVTPLQRTGMPRFLPVVGVLRVLRVSSLPAVACRYIYVYISITIY